MVFCVLLTARKKGREMISYILTLAGAAVVGLCVWPFALKHVFFGYRGAESLNVLRNGEFYYIRIKLMFDQVAAWLLEGHAWIVLLCLCILAVLFLWTAFKAFPAAKKRIGTDRFSEICLNLAKGGLVVVPIVFYTVVVAQIVPFLTTRYFMCTYPFWYLLVLGTVKLVLDIAPVKSVSGKRAADFRNVALAAVGAGLFALSGIYGRTPDNLNPGGQDTVELPENTDCVFILPDGDWN